MPSVILSSGDIAVRAPYIYAIHSAEWNALYIGQTFSQNGALGRLSQHLSNTSSNTFKQRLSSVYRIDQDDEVEINSKINFYAFRLTNKKKSFWRRNSDYLLAVEYLVQNLILNSDVFKQVNCIVVSRTVSNSYTTIKYVQDEAKRAVASIENWLTSL